MKVSDLRLTEVFDLDYSDHFVQRRQNEPYRNEVVGIIQTWSTPKLRQAILHMKPGQYEDPMMHQKMYNSKDRTSMIEYLANIVWGWGRDSCKKFIDQFKAEPPKLPAEDKAVGRARISSVI
jgi:hypothetical protein